MTGPRVLVAGLPRSGTTWVGEVLGRTDGARYLHEPDNHLLRPDAWWAKRPFGPYPELNPGDNGGDYERLWALAFAGGPRPSLLYAGARILQRAGAPHLSGRLASPGRQRGRAAAPGPLVVKSVHCARSVEWAVERFRPAVVVVERHPFGVISSWRKLGWDDFLDTDRGALRYSAAVLGVAPPPNGAPWLERAAWHYGVLSSYLARARWRHPDWLVVRHEVLCAGPEPAFRRLSARLGLGFTDEAARFLAASNRPGDGYSTHRLWHEQVDGGRSRLTPAERALVLATLEQFEGALPVPAEPSVTTVTEVVSSPSRPLIRSWGGFVRRSLPSAGVRRSPAEGAAVGDQRLDRREFLRLAAAGAVCAATVGAGCGSGSDGNEKPKAAAETKGGAAPKQLRIAQVVHFVPEYDAWFDQEYTRAWGERNGLQVIVDHITAGELTARATAEVSIRRGHDLFAFLSPPAAFEDDVVDLRDVVEELEAKVGKANRVAERSALNPKTNKWFGVPDYWFPELVNYRTDFWAGLGKGGKPDTWGDLLSAGPKLKAAGHPLGIDMSQDLDGNLNLVALLQSYGASFQNEDGVLDLDRPATVEAVKVAAALWSGGQAPDSLSWNDPAANNRQLATGTSSLILNPVSGLRAVEKQDPALARNIGLAPALAGPAARLSPTGAHTYVIWAFSENQEVAKRFLVDLVLAGRDTFLHSEFYNFPAFPGSVPDLADLVVGKYALVAQCPDWSTNLGYPGYTNAAVDDIFSQFLIPKMVAAAARGEMTAEEAVKATEARMKPIYDQWRERGKV